MTQKGAKYSSPYTLVRGPIEQNKVFSLYNARNNRTGEIWLAKIFNHQVISQFQMEDHIQYNEQVLENLKEKENIVYISEIFIKGEQTYIIQEKYQTKLSDYINLNSTLPASEIQQIIKSVFKGVCDIYEEQYVHRNLRAQHIVKITGSSQHQYTWKIQSLVLDNKEFPINTPFTWNRETASPQDIRQRDQLQEQQSDAQIVWNFGYLALQMLMGNLFMQKKASKQAEIPWSTIKERCTPNLFELINSCFRHKFKDRISLKRFFSLQIFDDVARPGIDNYFMTASKIFKAQTFSSIKHSINSKSMKSMRFQPSKIKPKQGQAYFQKIQQVYEQVYDQTDNKDATRFCFLLEVSKYLNLITSQSESSSKMNQNRIIIEFFFLKLALRFEQKARKGKNQERLNALLKQGQSKVQTQSRNIKRIKQKDNQLIKKYSLETKKEHTYQELIDIFNKLNGYAYTRLQQELQVKDDNMKAKAMAYFSLLAYLINVDNWLDLESLRGSAHTEYMSLFQSTNLDILVKFTQNLIKTYFQEAQ